MKHLPQSHLRLGLLTIAGILAFPLPIQANEKYAETGTADFGWSYSEAAAYDNLRRIQAAKSMMPAPQGAQGPIRTDNSDPVWEYSDSAAYDNLRRLQASKSMASTSQGAQGPIRTDSSDSDWSYEDGAVYDNLRKIQGSR